VAADALWLWRGDEPLYGYYLRGHDIHYLQAAQDRKSINEENMNPKNYIRLEGRSPIPRAVSRAVPRLRRNWIMTLILIGIFIWTFIPMLWTVTMSFKGVVELYTSERMTFFPRNPSLDNYVWMYEYLPDLPIYFKNSLIVTLGTVALQTFCASMMGYAFARIEFRGRDLIFYTLIIAMFIPHAGWLMAQYRLMHTLHLRNSHLGLILLFSANLAVPTFIMRQTYLSMPREIEDAAKIDGAGLWRLFLEIAFPYGASGMMVVAILAFVSIWGEYLTTFTMLDEPSKYTLGVGMAMFETGGAEIMQADGSVSSQGIQSAAYLMAALPAIILYIAMQKYFVKGMTEGAIKF
jgi:ABC-type glycerol-3-phosphate transport system permease component